jgi:hypothetical protein
MTAALRDLLPSETVLVVAGADWSAIIPYYSQHRALMIRNGLETDNAYLTRAFDELKDEPVGALVLVGNQRENHALVKRAAEVFGVDPTLAFSWANEADVYVNRLYRPGFVAILRGQGAYDNVAASDKNSAEPANLDIPEAARAQAFSMIRPVPSRFRFQFGFETWVMDGERRLNAHPDSDIWLPVTPSHLTLELAYGMRPEAYERDGDKTNGVVFSVDAEAPDGSTRPIFSRTLNPRDNVDDRGRKTSTVELHLAAGEKLVLRTRSNGDHAYDWAYWASAVAK